MLRRAGHPAVEAPQRTEYAYSAIFIIVFGGVADKRPCA
jgi:hypothetical protein